MWIDERAYHGVGHVARPLGAGHNDGRATRLVRVLDHQLAGGDACSGHSGRSARSGRFIISSCPQAQTELCCNAGPVEYKHERNHAVGEVLQRVQGQALVHGLHYERGDQVYAVAATLLVQRVHLRRRKLRHNISGRTKAIKHKKIDKKYCTSCGCGLSSAS